MTVVRVDGVYGLTVARRMMRVAVTRTLACSRLGPAEQAYLNAAVSAERMTFISLLMLFFISGYVFPAPLLKFRSHVVVTNFE
jgi:hypothetical protein